jgi:tetratricopeptide (TPR) repeat protein
MEMAVDYYNQALNIEYDAWAVLGLAIVAKNRGRYNEAMESLRRLIQQDPKNYRFYIELAECYMKKNDRNRAIETLGEFQKMGIRNPVVTDYLEALKA